jgi:NTP pyrophosphatase (non-canonical NTP hydrolase)
MDERTYAEAVQQTVVGGFHTDKVFSWEMDTFLTQATTIAARADRIERALFRGEPLDSHRTNHMTSVQLREDLLDITRGVIGVISEAGELAEILHKALAGEVALDRDSVLSECGDILWYLEHVYRQINADGADARTHNITKLWSRNGLTGEPPTACPRTDLEIKLATELAQVQRELAELLADRDDVKTPDPWAPLHLDD